MIKFKKDSMKDNVYDIIHAAVSSEKKENI